VEDVASIRHKLQQQGYRLTVDNQENPFRRRVYFETDDGLEWEFVEYYSDDIEKRNNYSD